MGNIIFRKGDLFTSEAQAIGHGVNTQGLMGAGIAVQFKTSYVGMFYAYKWLCDSRRLEPGTAFPYYAAEVDHRIIYNIASQIQPGANADILLLHRGVLDAINHLESIGLKTLALPAIGAGIGGLGRDQVVTILTGLVSDRDIDIEFWEL